MNLDEELNRFFKAYSTYDRQIVESDVFYQAALKEQDSIKATARAIEVLIGNAKTKRQHESLMKKRQKWDKIQEFI